MKASPSEMNMYYPQGSSGLPHPFLKQQENSWYPHPLCCQASHLHNGLNGEREKEGFGSLLSRNTNRSFSYNNQNATENIGDLEDKDSPSILISYSKTAAPNYPKLVKYIRTYMHAIIDLKISQYDMYQLNLADTLYQCDTRIPYESDDTPVGLHITYTTIRISRFVQEHGNSCRNRNALANKTLEYSLLIVKTVMVMSWL